MSEREVAAQIRQRLQEQGLLAADPLDFRYFQKGNGPMFCWTVEKDSEGEDDKGWYYSFTYKPTGRGSRSGEATRWDINWRSMRRHRKRKDAKARAWKLHNRHLGES